MRKINAIKLISLYEPIILALFCASTKQIVYYENGMDMNYEITSRNKELVRILYEEVLNNRDFELLKDIISDEYGDAQGLSGVKGFQNQVLPLISAFPDIKWELISLYAEGNTVIVKQKNKGTHLGKFHFFEPTNKEFVNHGIGLYEFKYDKIIKSEVHLDRLAFFQQLGLVPDLFSRQTFSKNISDINQDRNELSLIIDEYEKAFNTNNALKMNDLFMSDAIFVNFGGSLVLGKENLLKAQKFVFDEGGPLEHIYVKYSVENIHFIKNNVGIVHARQSTKDFSSNFTEKKDPMHSILMIIAEKDNGKWKIKAGQNTPVL